MRYHLTITGTYLFDLKIPFVEREEGKKTSGRGSDFINFQQSALSISISLEHSRYANKKKKEKKNKKINDA